MNLTIIPTRLTKKTVDLIKSSPLTMHAQATAYGATVAELRAVLEGKERPSVKLIAGISKATGWDIQAVADLDFGRPRRRAA